MGVTFSLLLIETASQIYYIFHGTLSLMPKIYVVKYGEIYMECTFLIMCVSLQSAMLSAEINELKKLLQNETHLRKTAEEEISSLRNQLAQWKRLEVWYIYF